MTVLLARAGRLVGASRSASAVDTTRTRLERQKERLPFLTSGQVGRADSEARTVCWDCFDRVQRIIGVYFADRIKGIVRVDAIDRICGPFPLHLFYTHGLALRMLLVSLWFFRQNR